MVLRDESNHCLDDARAVTSHSLHAFFLWIVSGHVSCIISWFIADSFISAFRFQDGMVSKLQWLSFWWGHIWMIFSVRICLSITKHSFLWKEIFTKPGNGLKWLFWFSMKTRTFLKFGWLVMGRVIMWTVLALFPRGMVTSWPGAPSAPESQSAPSLPGCCVMESANTLSFHPGSRYFHTAAKAE